MHSNGTCEPAISIAMCTFNGGRYLTEQLESIASQSRLPSELIVCDDGSTDDTIALLNRFKANAPFSVTIVKNAARMGSTRNFDQAIGMAQGEFIALCDQDDRWLPHKLDRLSRCLVDNAFLGGVFSDAELIDGDGRRVGKTVFGQHRFTPAKQRSFVSCPTATLLKHDVITGATLMFRSNIRRYCSPIPATWVHDGWLAWMLALHSRVTLIAEPLIEYRIHAGQQLGVESSQASQRGSRETRRQFYARVARQFEDLLSRVTAEGWSQNDALVENIRQKIAFLKSQAALSTQPGARAMQMLGLLPKYLHYARGLASVRKDLLLGREML
ncbi:glycosyltransferase family 2 protein [Occallatibacter savannae]|uniref:glycosyltransferase family 2 protein n=1 Tax=Occallatibacter savannae TaxID=1002691 RepID=UPI0013A58710|nr:glycosyltransferase family 2 protein [Occallatibacter savannae]